MLFRSIVLNVAVDEQVAVGGDVNDLLLVAALALLVIDADGVLISGLGAVEPAVGDQLVVAGLVALDESSQVAAAIQEQVVADLARQQLGIGLISLVLDMLADAGLDVLHLVAGGDGLGLADVLLNGDAGDHFGQIGLSLAIDDGVVHYVVRVQLVSGNDLLTGQVVQIVNAAGPAGVLVGQSAVLGVQGVLAILGSGDLGHSVDDLEDVIGLAVAIVIDDLDPVAVLVLGNGLQGIGGDVLLNEGIQSDLVGKILGTLGAGIDLAGDIGVGLIGNVEDPLDVVLMLGGDVDLDGEGGGVGEEIGRASCRERVLMPV